MTEAALQSDGGWRASLRLGFRPAPGKTVLAERFRAGPLSVQRPFYPEGETCHVYLLHPPGGVAGGDRLDVRAAVAAGASALVTTPGATKFYRSAGAMATQHQTLSVDGGTLEWLPQENILFPGAKVELHTRVDLGGAARFIGWEIHCLGRPAIDERFDHGSADMGFQLYRDGLPLLLERQVIGGTAEWASQTPNPASLRACPVFASLYATPADGGLVDRLREVLVAPELGITLVDGILVLRYLGDSVAQATLEFVRAWEAIRPALIGKPVCPPRIWNT
jgi:urease accessory protein